MKTMPFLFLLAAGLVIATASISGAEQGVAAKISPESVITRADNAPKRGEFTVVHSLADLREHLGRDGARVRLAPGTYRDAVYSQVLDISTAGSRNSDVEITVLDSRSLYGHRVLATVNGSGHRVVLKEGGPGFMPTALSIHLGQARSAPGAEPAVSRATCIDLNDLTATPVVLHPTTSASTIVSVGPVTDRGRDNHVRQPSP